jgi:DNA-binding GntR family transcriptional regulator
MFDDEFHRIVYRGCGKERIWEFIKKLDNSHDRLRIMTLPIIGEGIFDEHRRILELLKESRSDLVDAVVEGHLTNSVIGKVILDYPREYFRQDPLEYARKIGAVV